MNPPEYKVNVDLVKSDQVHAYMLGKNIYQFLTCCSPRYLEQHIDGKSYCMDNSIFKTTYGEKLSQLIRGLIKKNPTKRIDIEQILSQFRVIKKELLNDQILTFKNTLYRIENNNMSDPLLIEYIQHFKNQTFVKENLEALIKLNEYLTNIQRISDMISKLIIRLNDHGEHKKATTLENYFYKIPPEERLSIFSSQREEAKQFRASLAEHRYFFRQPITYKDPEKTIIDEYWASHSFVLFKKAVTKLNVAQNNDHCFDK